MKSITWFFLFLGLPFMLAAQTVSWKEGQSAINISNQISVFEDVSGRLNLQEILEPAYQAQFEASTKNIMSFGITESCFWLSLDIHNPTSEKLVVELAQYGLPLCEFHSLQQDGTWLKTELGYDVSLRDRLFNDHFQVFPLQQGENKIYVKVQTYSPPIAVKVIEEGQYEYESMKLKIAYGVYLGILIFVILNNVFLFFSLRSSIYLLYSVLVVMHILIAATVMDGFGMYLFSSIDYHTSYLLVPAITMLVTITYSLLFLEVKKYSKRLYRLGWLWFAYVAVFIISQSFLPLITLVILNQIHAVVSLFITLYLGFFVAKRGNKVGYYFAAAYTFYFGFTILEILYIQTGSPAYIFGLSHVAIAILMEVLLLSYALSKRFQWERKESLAATLDAQSQVILKTQENERIVKAQNVTLEKMVAERTNQLEKTNIQLSNTLQTVEEEKAKSEALLLNILPKATAEELKEKGFSEPRDFENVSVLFTDFKDFTSTTSAMTPQRLVEDLNECFKAFDAIVFELGLEKIKTIGDAYMAASGLPIERKTHAVLVVKCALRILGFINDWQHRQEELGRQVWQIRIGIHSGPVVAGVVGQHKFAYDIWGDAVNIAARMESNSSPGKINISESTFNLVKEHFQCSPRGNIAVKGKGEMKMFWVESELEQASHR